MGQIFDVAALRAVEWKQYVAVVEKGGSQSKRTSHMSI